jgi:hypothetical protein
MACRFRRSSRLPALGSRPLQHLLSRAVWDDEQVLDIAAVWAASDLPDRAQSLGIGAAPLYRPAVVLPVLRKINTMITTSGLR